MSFPTITATFWSIRVPNILLFVGKRLDTGVILSTAFVHLLQDAFKALHDPVVNKTWKVGHWAGPVVYVLADLPPRNVSYLFSASLGTLLCILS